MKGPDILAQKLARKWNKPTQREALLLDSRSWPIEIKIGKLTARELQKNPILIKQLLQDWRNVSIGKIEWQSVRFRGFTELLELPTIWRLHKPSEWIDATSDPHISRSYQHLTAILPAVDVRFHSLLIKQLYLHQDKDQDSVVLAAKLALQLTPGIACGAPLRTLTIEGVDSKFYERHRRLLITLMDVIHNSEVSNCGLEAFLDAATSGEHWLLVDDLDGNLMPFRQTRIRTSELIKTALPGRKILVIENEKCLYHLPPLKEAIAVAGSGFDLGWMRASWLTDRQIAYWGDIDTWGLKMLSIARESQPTLHALMMDRQTFEEFESRSAVAEPIGAGKIPPPNLTLDERGFYQYLLSLDNGRLEQEFLSKKLVTETVIEWAKY